MTKKLLTFSIVLCSLFSFGQKYNLKKDLEDIIKNKQATVAVSVNSLDDNFNLNISGDKRLPMQSVFKFHIALAILDGVDKGDIALNDFVLITRNQLLENTWSPMRERFPKKGNVKIRLSQILKYTVSESDNNGADILIRMLDGPANVEKFITQQGIKDFSIKFNEEEMHRITDLQYQNYTTTNSLNQLLKRFYEGKIVSKESTEFLMNALVETNTGKKRLIAQLPQVTTLAHKTGTSFTENGLTAATNDAGIVTLPNGKHYVISVFVSDSKENEETNEKIIADISKKVFDYFLETNNHQKNK